jgi:hypothetical protein
MKTIVCHGDSLTEGSDLENNLGVALLRRPLLTVCGSFYCFIPDKFFYLITFRLSRLTVDSGALVDGTMPLA